MKHHKQGRTLGRDSRGRLALLKSLARSLVLHGKIRTTEARAKEVRPFIERLVTKGKSDSLSTRRLIRSRLGGLVETNKLISEIAPRYKERQGGYTRVVKLERRVADASPMALITFV